MVTQTDRAVIAVCGTTFLAFVIDAWHGSFWLLYLNVLIVVALFYYAIRQNDVYASELVRSIICGVAASVIYILLDWKLSAELQGNDKGRLIDYLRPDLPWLPTAPLNLLLTFLIVIILMILPIPPIALYFRKCLHRGWGNKYSSVHRCHGF